MNFTNHNSLSFLKGKELTLADNFIHFGTNHNRLAKTDPIDCNYKTSTCI